MFSICKVLLAHRKMLTVKQRLTTWIHVLGNLVQCFRAVLINGMFTKGVSK